MSIRVVCPQGHELHVNNRWHGRSGRCPICRSALVVPQLVKRSETPPTSATTLLTTSNSLPIASETLSPEVALKPRHAAKPAPALPAPLATPQLSAPPQVPRVSRAPAPIASAIHSGGLFVSTKQERLVMMLVAGMGMLGILALLPALIAARDGFAPLYSRAALLCGLWQLGLAVWLLTVPDWSSLRITMICHAVLAALYGTLLAATLATPPAQQLFWDLSDVRGQASPWCGGMLTLTVLMAYASGAAAAQWKRQLQKAIRGAVRAAG